MIKTYLGDSVYAISVLRCQCNREVLGALDIFVASIKAGNVKAGGS